MNEDLVKINSVGDYVNKALADLKEKIDTNNHSVIDFVDKHVAVNARIAYIHTRKEIVGKEAIKDELNNLLNHFYENYHRTIYIKFLGDYLKPILMKKKNIIIKGVPESNDDNDYTLVESFQSGGEIALAVLTSEANGYYIFELHYNQTGLVKQIDIIAGYHISFYNFVDVENSFAMCHFLIKKDA